MQNDVYCSSGEGKENMKIVLEKALKDCNISGKNILIKPNAVNPDNSIVCSNYETIQNIVDVLLKYDAGKIIIGDEPAGYNFYEAMKDTKKFDIFEAYEKLGYDKIMNAKLVSLEDFKLTQCRCKCIVTKMNHSYFMPIRNFSEYLLVSLSLPKNHGQFNYTGAIKNNMGLVPHDDRGNFFHSNLGNLDELIAEQNPAVIFIIKQLIDKKLTNDNLTVNYQLDHLANAGSLVSLNNYIKSLKGIHLMDGTYFVQGNETAGTQLKTDFAIAGFNPSFVDYVAMQKLGINIEEVLYAYLCDDYSKMNIIGNLGEFLPKKSVLQKELVNTSHGSFSSVKINQ
ncbi:MAG: DUF362 domain-containing protein [Candidatus Nanoarchaeia archaeon]|jgi:hypothetical protein